jgi:AcrR family transcriptional regulator
MATVERTGTSGRVNAGAKRVSKSCARVGGRSARVVSAVLRSTLEVLGRRGYAGLRIDDVAEESGVNKTTIYRRWPNRADLVSAALTHLAAPPLAQETGRLECDLCATFMTATTLRATRAGRGVVRALITERGDPEVDRVVAEMRERHRMPAREILIRARRRGDIPRHADIELILDVLTGTVYSQLRASAEPLDERWVRGVVRLVLTGVGATTQTGSQPKN